MAAPRRATATSSSSSAARCRLFELFDAHPVGSTARPRRWRAGSGATWSLRSTRLRPFGWTSADAAGLPILPGLARWPEVRSGRIDHALRITVPRTRRAAIPPARHVASGSTDPDLPAMGQRLRLKASVDVARFPRQARVVLRGLREYGGIVADNGSAWFVSGAPDRHWDDDALPRALAADGRRPRGRRHRARRPHATGLGRPGARERRPA